VLPEQYAGPDGLPEGIIQVTDSSEPALISEFIDVIATSFCGSTDSAPEAALSWAYDPDASGENPTDVLMVEPSAARVKYFKALGGFCVHSGLRHGGCFALKGANGKLVAATVTFPPNNKNLHKTGICEILHIVKKLGGAKNLPPEMKGGDSEKRMQQVSNAMEKSHKTHAKGLHLYVLAFASAIGHQGQGYGRKLMAFLVESARRMNVPAYLECSGEKNERFYKNNGYALMQRYELKYKDQTFSPNGGMAAMVLQNN
jgi:hypothetical protein